LTMAELILTASLLMTAMVIVGGCSDATVNDPGSIVFPDSAVSYRNHVDPFLTLSCGQCHSGSNAAGGIDLTNYSSLLFDRPNLVVPGLPNESLLCMVLERTVAHPVGNIEFIPSNHVVGTRVWVAEGAKNN
jgi:hypothetical protein